MKFINKRFSRLVVIDDTGKKQGKNKIYKCLCDCGNTTEVPSSSLGSKRTKSCGCLRKEIQRNRNLIHGYRYDPIWRSWNSMKQRCSNSKHPDWKRYGGRGITICDSWVKLENFMADMGERPEDHDIHRIDNDKGYYPGNCEWKEKSKHRKDHNQLRRNCEIS